MAEIKRIAVLHPLMGFAGGAENLIYWTSEELSRRGIEVTVFTRLLPKETPPWLKMEFAEMDLRVWKWPRVAGFLAEKLVSFDAVMFHNFPTSVYWYLAKRYARRKQFVLPPALYYCHEPCRPWYGKSLQEYRRVRWKRFWRLDLPAMNNIRLDKKGVAEAAGLAANSKRSADYAAQIYGKKFEVIYPGLPPALVKDFSVKPERDRFVYLSRLHWVKNVRGAIRAYKLFLEAHPESKADLHILGEGSEEVPARALVEELGIVSRVHFAGFVSDEEAARQFSQAIAVLNVAFEEPFGLVTLECWARSTPLILSREAGSAEITHSGENVLLVDPASPGSIAEAMGRLYKDPAFRDDLARRGWENLKKGFLIQ
ncbi:MAG: glycosyltransferase family 4 protein, partial [Spirochaetia bacterium]|nr:glycosyltransferase family 4 protein [Spirochaetia bacterium]